MSDGRLWAVVGRPGSGKSSLARALAERLGRRYLSVGDLFREAARANGRTLEEWGAYAESHPEVDRELDERVRAYWNPEYVLDSRLHGFLARRAGVPVWIVRVTCAPEVRAGRVAARDGLPLAVARARILRREESERARYLGVYGFDPEAEPVDRVVDTTNRSVEEALGLTLRPEEAG